MRYATHALFLLASTLALLALPVAGARAAQSYDSCTGFINSLPATLSTSGVWCLRKDLSTAITSGAAITVATNNVTLDCNDFKVGGLGAGAASQTTGVRAVDRQNVTVRHCSVRGFLKGIDLDEGAGQLVEDNNLDNNLLLGIRVSTYSGVVRNNRVTDTGGATATIALRFSPGVQSLIPNATAGIAASNSVMIDNVVDGLFGPESGSYSLAGMFGAGDGLATRQNVVRGIASTAQSGTTWGIVLSGVGGLVASNVVARSYTTTGSGKYGISSDNTARCVDNVSSNFSTAFAGCTQP